MARKKTKTPGRGAAKKSARTFGGAGSATTERRGLSVPSLRRPEISERGRDLLTESIVLGSLAGLTLILVAMVTYAPPPGDGSPAPERALVGAFGHWLAGGLWNTFGIVAFALIGLGLFTALVRLVKRRVTAPWMRTVGAALLLFGLCALIHQVLRPKGLVPAGSHPFDIVPGGSVGAFVSDAMAGPFGQFGAFLFAVVLTCTGFAFATDWLVYEMLLDGVRKLLALFGQARRLWPSAALSVAGAESSGPPPTGGERDARELTSAAVATLAPPVATADPPKAPEAVVDVALRPAPKSRGSRRGASAGSPKVTLDFSSDGRPSGTTPDTLDGAFALTPAVPAAPPAPPVATVPARVADEPARAEPAVVPGVVDDDLEAAAADAGTDAGDAPVLHVHLEDRAEAPKPARVQRPRKKGSYELPSLELLDPPKPRDLRALEKAIQENAEILQRTLQEFRVDARVVAFQQGPVVTMLEVALAPGTKVTKVHSLSDDLAMALKVEKVRIVAPIPGKSTVGVEIPNPIREDVRLLTLLEEFGRSRSKAAVPLLLGMQANGDGMIDDLAKMPHLLVAGATGSGKSVCINTILCSILMTRSPDEVRLILIDPKQVELAFFADVPHLLSPVVTNMKRASSVLEWAVQNMEERYDLLRRFEVRNIASYNELGEKAIRERIAELGLSDEVIPVRLPYTVIVVDELADLLATAGKDVEKLIQRLAQKSRAVGIHVILATQRPSTDVITGLIKANMPTRIAFQVTSKIDSRVVLDQNGADRLLGMGDMLYLPPRSSALVRAQGTYVSDKEVKSIVRFLKERYTQEFDDELTTLSSSDLLDEAEKDSLYDEAVRVVLTEQRGSASLLQRALAIGYTRASRLLDLMRKEGVVGPYKGSKASDVEITLEQYEQLIAEKRGVRKG